MILSPSLLSADFSRLADELAALEAAGISWLHLDIMDGAFVPNITFGQPVIKSLRKRSSKLFFDVHLMIEEPARYLESFRDAGADMLVIHAEADRHPQRTLSEIRRLGMKAGLAFNPGTDIASLRWLAPDLDMVLVMSVNPGFSGQKFIPQSFDKIRHPRHAQRRRCRGRAHPGGRRRLPREHGAAGGRRCRRAGLGLGLLRPSAL